MKEEIYNEQELQKLEEEIRAMGIPFSSNEPDERYFANFRVRLMERIDAKQQKKNILASVWSWISSSPLRSLSIGAGLAAVVIAALLIRPTPQVQVAKIEPAPQKVETSLPPAPKDVPQLVATVPKVPQKVKAVSKPDKNLALKSRLNAILKTAENPDDLAITNAVVSGTDSNEPVDLESLSASELESVLSAVESIK